VRRIALSRSGPVGRGKPTRVGVAAGRASRAATAPCGLDGSFMLDLMDAPNDAPAWLTEVVGPRWGEAEWSKWKDSQDRLAALGVPATHVKPVGPLDRPTDLSAHIPSLTPWVSVPVDWQRFGDKDALLHAFDDLVTELTKTA
jgi:hypothetical protein